MTAIKITTKRIDNMTDYEILRCRTLTLGNMGEMRDEFDTQAAYAKDRRPADRARVFMAWNGDRIIGWCMTFYPMMHDPLEPRSNYFFVEKRWRNRGIGTRLMKAATRKIGPTVVYPHDAVSGSFFRKNVDHAHNQKEVMRWLY